MSLIRILALGAAGVGVVVLAALVVGGQEAGTPAPEPVALVAPAPVERVVPETRAEMQMSFAPVVRRVAPAVVNVYATRLEQRAVSPFAGDPFFERFFGGRSPFFESRPRESQSLGSGVIVDADGLILTNSHVVTGATDIRVVLSDRREFAVELVLDDPETDLAVLRLREEPDIVLPVVGFADSDALEVGDLVLAIGNPFGVGQTVTSGIVSALARTGIEASDYGFFIQTDAAINPGNSGGALVDLSGRLVGINTAIYTRTGGSVGIGFAIPASMARIVAEAGRAGGEIARPWLGARTQIVTPDIAASMRLLVPIGAMITDVAPGGPAERAGLRPGDVVTALDGVTIEDPGALTFRLATKPSGGEARVEIVRGGERLAAALPLEAPPIADASRIAEISGNSRFAGVTAQALDPALAQRKGLAFDARGMIVTAIAPGSPAQALGLMVDDVVLSLNGVEMHDPETFRATASQRVRTWDIVLERGGRVIRSYVGG